MHSLQIEIKDEPEIIIPTVACYAAWTDGLVEIFRIPKKYAKQGETIFIRNIFGEWQGIKIVHVVSDQTMMAFNVADHLNYHSSEWHCTHLEVKNDNEHHLNWYGGHMKYKESSLVDHHAISDILLKYKIKRRQQRYTVELVSYFNNQSVKQYQNEYHSIIQAFNHCYCEELIYKLNQGIPI